MKQQKYLVQGSNNEWIMVDDYMGNIENGETVYLITIEKKFEVVEEKKLKLEEIKIK